MKHITIAFLILLSCTGCRQKGRNKVLLRLTYHKGDVFDIRYQTYITADGNDDPLQNEYQRMTFRVDSVYRNGQYRLSARFVYIRINNEWPMPELFSSDKEELEMSPRELAINNQFKAVKDSVFTLTVDNRGQLIKPLAFANGTQIPKQFAPIDYEKCQIVFPQDSVVTGDDWTNERVNPVDKTKQTYTYTLYSIKEAVMEIGVKGELHLPNGGDTYKFGGEYVVNRNDQNLVSAHLEVKANTADRGKVTVGIVINGPH